MSDAWNDVCLDYKTMLYKIKEVQNENNIVCRRQSRYK